jgi:G:T-mismatch repair DNA endonuclease (very short patch repair protein)
MSDQNVTVSKEPFGILKQFYRAKLIADHARALRSWPRWQQIGHRLLVGWRCEGCRAYRNGEHKGWGLEDGGSH